MKKRTAWVLVAAVAAVAIGAAAVGALALLLRGNDSSSTWAGKSYLYLNLGSEIPEQPPVELPSFLERRPPTLRTLVDSIDRAGSDSKVDALINATLVDLKHRVTALEARVGSGRVA